MSDPEVDDALSRSRDLLMRVRQQLKQGSSYVSDLKEGMQPPIAVPFLSNSVSLEDGTLRTDTPPPPTSTVIGEEATQRRLREMLSARLQAIDTRPDSTMVATTTLEAPVRRPEPAEGEEEEDIPNMAIFSQRPILDECFVLPGEQTTTAEPAIVCLSTPENKYPNPTDADAGIVLDEDLAEDGLWVPDVPMVKAANVARLECRLAWEEPTQDFLYFSPDHAMRIDTPPLSQIPPPFPIEPVQPDGRMVRFSKTTAWGVEDVSISRDIVIEISHIRFLVHALSSKEDLLVARLQHVFEAFSRDQQFSQVRYYEDRVMALWRELSADPPQEKQIEYLQALKECYEMRDMHEHNSRMLFEAVIETWRALKQHRADSGIRTSPVTLKWQTQPFNQERTDQEQCRYDELLAKRAEGLCQLHELTHDGERIDPREVMRGLRATAVELHLRMPGDPRWRATLKTNAEVSAPDACPLEEQQRRDKIGQATVYVAITVDGNRVDATPTALLDNAFQADVRSFTTFQTTQIPQRIALEVWETGYVRARWLGAVALPMTVGEPPEPGLYEFTSSIQNPEGPHIMGCIGARCYIQPSAPGQEILIRPPDGQAQKVKRRLAGDPSAFISVDRYREWAVGHDPNDPYVPAILASHEAQRTDDRLAGKFRLDPELATATFESLVPTTIGRQLEKHMEKLRQEDEERRKTAAPEPGVSDFVATMKKTEVVHAAKVARRLEITDVVREAPMPTVPALFGWVRAIMSMYRPLKPIRTPRIETTNLEAYSRILVRVVRAMNVPERSKAGTGPGTAATLVYSSTQTTHAHVYARIRFRKSTKTTRRAPGDSAEWNESVEWPVSNNQGEALDIPVLARENIRIDLFDEIEFTVVQDDRDRQTRHELVESRHLGMLEIPVSSIWATGKLEGTYSLITPSFQLGYNDKGESLRLTVYATLDPPLLIPDRNQELSSAESEAVILRVQRWLQHVKAAVKSPRRCVLMAAPTGGKPILACRMITPQTPPHGWESLYQIIRFVSMIPNVSDAAVFDTEGDVWCTSQEFLNLGGGDEEEHAILLCNLVRSQGIDAYVALGFDLVNGTTAFVVTRSAGKIALIDPLTGTLWSSRDRFCSLYSVGVVFNHENVWANLQDGAEPYRIDWNLHDKSKWFPFFTPEFPMTALESPQEEHLQYKPIDESKARRLERQLEYEIAGQVQAWREHQQTNWDPQFADGLRAALHGCEKATMADPPTNNHSAAIQIAEAHSNYRMTGAPFCMSFTGVAEVIEEVRTREAWKTEASDCVFALAVSVAPYPNGMFVVWVVLACFQLIQSARAPM
jgi:coiled-coil and C2 domain-containing protein 2A